MYGEFDLSKLTVSCGGALASGFGTGDYCTIEMNTDLAALQVGADGEGARVKKFDKSGQIRLTLLQTAEFNETLTAHAKSRADFAFALIDRSGTTVATAAHCWVKTYPSVAYGDEVTTREWTLESDSIELFVGSNVV